MLRAGTESQCNHAIDYIDFIKQQRVGPVTIDTERSRGDYTAYTVPGDCIGFVMGRNGQTLRCDLGVLRCCGGFPSLM